MLHLDLACPILVRHCTIHMLVGEELLDFVESNPNLDEHALAQGAGYIRETKTGKTLVLVKKFTSALLASKGLQLGTPVTKSRGKSALYLTTVHKSGVILLGRTYSEAYGLEPGTKLGIEFLDDGIKLVINPEIPAEEAEEEVKTAGKAAA